MHGRETETAALIIADKVMTTMSMIIFYQTRDGVIGWAATDEAYPCSLSTITCPLHRGEPAKYRTLPQSAINFMVKSRESLLHLVYILGDTSPTAVLIISVVIILLLFAVNTMMHIHHTVL